MSSISRWGRRALPPAGPALPTTDYRSKATLALTKLLREELSGKNADKKTPSPSNQINEGAL